MAAYCTTYLLGTADAANPLTDWSWAPAALAVAAAWLFLVPLSLSWRTRWSGVRPSVLRSTDVRQEEALVIGDETLAIGPASWRYDQLQAPRLRRWDSPADKIYGWVLYFDPPSGSVVHLVAPEPNRKKWKNSPMELIEVPYEAWQLDPRDFAALRDRVL
jgi:hypothetical protein